MISTKPKVIYILGHPYSGSTLFSIALGNSKGIVNLGEVSYLENDYNDNVQCLCGSRLVDCEFWQEIKANLNRRQQNIPQARQFLLNNEASLSAMDSRNKAFSKKVMQTIGISEEKIYSRKIVEDYAQKQEIFFKLVSEITGEKYLLDCSKGSQRLNILSKYTDVDLKVIWLKRNMESLFNSKIKRVKRRAKRYHPLFSIYTISWLLALHLSSERVYNSIPDESRFTTHFEDFLKKPIETQSLLSELLGEKVDFNINARNAQKVLTLRKQHVYVGNRWLFNNQSDEIQLRDSTKFDSLGKWEETIYQLFSVVFPGLVA